MQTYRFCSGVSGDGYSGVIERDVSAWSHYISSTDTPVSRATSESKQTGGENGRSLWDHAFIIAVSRRNLGAYVRRVVAVVLTMTYCTI